MKVEYPNELTWGDRRVAIVSSNPNELWKLAFSCDRVVRELVAGNVFMPLNMLELLLDDPEENVRRSVAGNPTLPEEYQLAILEKSQDDECARTDIAGNPGATLRVQKLLANDPSFLVRYCLADNTWTFPEVFEILASDEDECIREVVAKNPNTPRSVLERLKEDENLVVRNLAICRLACE